MATHNEELPEGTDSIIVGASAEDVPLEPIDAAPETDEQLPGAGLKSAAKSAVSDVGDAALGLKDQAADKARGYALLGKDKAVGALENVTKLVNDAAETLDDKLGSQFGDYARRASAAIEGVSSSIDGKDVDQLFDEAKDVIRKSPALAIGAAAVVGFALARVVKAGATAATEALPADDAAPKSSAV